MTYVKGYSLVQKYLGVKEVEVSGVKNLKELLSYLDKRYGLKIEFNNKIFYLMGKPITIFINGREATDLEQAVDNSDSVIIFPVIDGG